MTAPQDHDRGLSFDLATMSGRRPMDRRRALQMVADGYAQSVTNLASLALESDMVFADGSALQLATATGSVDDGVAMRLPVVV